MNNESEVIDDIAIESDESDDDSQPVSEEQVSSSDETSSDALGDTQLGQDLGQLITDIRRDEESFRRSSAPGEEEFDADPFDPSNFSLDTPFDSRPNQAEDAASADSDEAPEAPALKAVDDESAGDGEATTAVAQPPGASAESTEVESAIAKLVSEIETALQRFTQSERQRADQLIAEKEAQVAEQYRKLRSLADKVAKQKAQIQEAKKELKAKLELADRLHIEFDGIRQVLNGKLGVLEELDKEDEAAA